MNSRAARLLFATTTLAALAFSVPAQTTNRWRVFTRTDGLADNVCVSVSVGASGNVLVRHLKAAGVSVLDGYDVTVIPAPENWRHRIYESPGGQLWSVSATGLQEYRDGQWVSYRLPEIAAHFEAGRSNEIPLLPVRQGRVLVLLPDRLLQFSAEDPEHPGVELIRRAEAARLGTFTNLLATPEGVLWLAGTRGYEMNPGSVRNLRPDQTWMLTNQPPAQWLLQQNEPPSADELGVRKVFDSAVDRDGGLWVATSEGLYRRAPMIWEAIAGPMQLPAAAPEIILPADLPDHLAKLGGWRTTFTSRSGDLWLGGAPGVAWRHQGEWRVYSATNQFGPEETIAFAEAPDGRIWGATTNQLWEFDGRNWLDLQSGFARIHALFCARDGTLWVATENGVHRYTQGTWLVNGPEDGLPGANVQTISEDESGSIVVTTLQGRARFNPKADTEPPRTQILTELEGDPEFREGALITLAYRGRDKWKLTAASRLLFSYRLDEREWSPFEEMREVSFSSLPVGKHYFTVRAMDRNANVESKPVRLEFAVVVPWYRETRLVLILSGALGVAIFFAALAVNRHRRLKLSYAEVERKIAERTRELEVANRELVQSQKMNALGTLAAGIAHDFNNILSIIKGSAQLIEDNLDKPEKIRTRLDRIKTVVQQGAGIVEAMLGFSRSTDQPPAPCDLNVIVEETRKLLGDRFLREIEVRFERGASLPEVSIPRDFVQQILLNFIFNAAEAMERRPPARRATSGPPAPAPLENPPPPPRERKQILLLTQRASKLPPEIFLSPAAALEYVLISVRDTGSGIAPENMTRIFEPFFTTKALSTKRGTGLGLSMVYELARKMEAGLAVESVLGAGSTFTLILPVNGKANSPAG